MQKKSFLYCSKCDGRIELSLEELIYGNHITCPNCNLIIYFNVPQKVINSLSDNEIAPAEFQEFSEPEVVTDTKNLSRFITSVEE